MMDDQRADSAPLGWPVPRACACKAAAPKLSTATYTDHQRDRITGLVMVLMMMMMMDDQRTASAPPKVSSASCTDHQHDSADGADEGGGVDENDGPPVYSVSIVWLNKNTSVAPVSPSPPAQTTNMSVMMTVVVVTTMMMMMMMILIMMMRDRQRTASGWLGWTGTRHWP